MKKFIYLLLVSFFVFTSCNQDEEIIDLSSQNKPNTEKKNLKVDICHYDEDTGEFHTINVSENAVEAHLAHGDILGNCDDNLICHWVDPVTNIWEPMLVKDNDLQAHLDHGDFLGYCGTNPGSDFTYIPDVNFEQALIDLGIDSEGDLNKRVLTSDISGITDLSVSDKNISSLTGIEDFKSLVNLTFRNNQITNIDLSNNILLLRLKFDNNQFKSIDLSNNTLLKELFCINNQLTSLDISQNTNLIFLYCQSNQLTSLDVSQNTSLTKLRCFFNELESLDVSQNTSLTELSCYNNKLEVLNVKNGNNGLITTFWAINNTSLQCIQVDNEIDAINGEAPYNNWHIDSEPLETYSENCGS